MRTTITVNDVLNGACAIAEYYPEYEKYYGAIQSRGSLDVNLAIQETSLRINLLKMFPDYPDAQVVLARLDEHLIYLFGLCSVTPF